MITTFSMHQKPAVKHLFLFVTIALVTCSLGIEKGEDVLWINGHHTPFLDFFFSAITRAGNGLVFIPILLATLFIRFRYSLIVFGVCLANALIVQILKRILFAGLERPRKFLGDSWIHFVNGIDVHTINTFPSGHTVSAFSAAIIVMLLTRNRFAGMIALTLALFVGISRVYLAQHFLTDVAAGAVIGSVSSYCVWYSIVNTPLPPWTDKRIQLFRKGARRSENTLGDA